MNNTYDTFTLRISQHDGIEARWLTRDSEQTIPDQRITEQQFLLEDIENSILELKKTDSNVPEADIQRLGRNLYLALFPNEVGQAFEGAIAKVLRERGGGDTGHCLRVIIDIHPKCKAFGWPLEFLRTPKGHWLATEKPWLALSRRTTFGGVISLDLERHSWPLRVLVIVSKPKDLQGVLSAKVLEEIGKLAETRSGPDGGPARKMEVKVLGHVEDYERGVPGIEYIDRAATWANIREITSSDWQPHVVHFIGHGRLEKDEGSLALVTSEQNSEARWCNAEQTTQLFAVVPRLILLQACESGAPGSERGYMSLATNLLQRNILAVIAMQFEIRNDDAILFAVGFYEALRDGLDVDAAVQNGRWKICNEVQWSKRYCGGPVLYMHQPFGIIQPGSTRGKSRLPLQPRMQRESLSRRPLNSLEQALVMVSKASDLLDEEDVATARIWLGRACSKLQLVASKQIIKDIEGALDFLDLDDIEGAKEMLERAPRSSTILPTAEKPLRAERPVTKMQSQETSDLQDQLRPPIAETVAPGSTGAGWSPESERPDDRIKQA